MRSIPKSARYEIKFVANELELNKILNWINLHSANFVCPHPDRQVNNIYFDTYDYSSYEENLTGASSRAKLRYRWYGTSKFAERGVLEVKLKRNFSGWKVNFPISELESCGCENWRDIRNTISRQLPPDGKVWMNQYPQPVLINRYQRKYFVSNDGNIRVTVDTNQQVFDQRMSSLPNFRSGAHIAKNLVVEFKFDGIHKNIASDFIQSIPIRVSRNSKYILGVHAIKLATR